MLNFIRTTASAAVFGVMATFAGTTQAGILAPDTGWASFCTIGTGTDAYACGTNGIGNTIELTLASDSYLQVTDAYVAGDIYEVYIDSVLAFTTSTPGGVGLPIELDPDAAFADSFYSSGSILLTAGVYSIDIFASAAPFLLAGGFVQAITATATAVSAPSVLLLMGLGLLLLLSMRPGVLARQT